MSTPEANPRPQDGPADTGHIPMLAWVYLALAMAGALLPWLANLDYIHQYGGSFDLGLFVQLANANPAAQSLTRDLLVGASAVTLWMVNESRRLGMRHLWLVLLISVTIAFACAAPLFLHLRERRLAEMARGPAAAAGT
jgi:Terpene cyclase DEP1